MPSRPFSRRNDHYNSTRSDGHRTAASHDRPCPHHPPILIDPILPSPPISSSSSSPPNPFRQNRSNPQFLLPWSQPSLWGRPTWMFLYCVVKTFPEQPSTRQKREYLLFFHSISSILPCKLCRRHYRQWLRRHPIEDHLGCSEQLEAWLLDLHNYIRQRLRKPPIPDFQIYFFTQSPS